MPLSRAIPPTIGARVARNSGGNLTIGAGATGLIACPDTVFETPGYGIIQAANRERLYLPLPGVWLIMANVVFTNATVAAARARILLNGSVAVLDASYQSPGTGSAVTPLGALPVYVSNNTSYIEFSHFTTGAGSASVIQQSQLTNMAVLYQGDY